MKPAHRTLAQIDESPLIIPSMVHRRRAIFQAPSRRSNRSM
jgi:hypothetical protein